ncbi:auxin-responsive protein SAUR32-like [Ipomoea triloba]|uniref:auxin-responsive protein SAUR32-like n=1 Tax=Ipomoea triloba TaxID=35885 RepID=UPI00125D5295|nr:auxin-responsive protein SAUR32-like [Ipomoea triloba]
MEDVVREGKTGGKKALIIKTWERCKSLGVLGKNPSLFGLMKSKSWSHGLRMEKRIGVRAAPEGWLWVCVGEEKQRLLIKTERVNHPLFRELLEEAESEYGFRSDGPLIFPCEVDHFLRVLREMESSTCENNNGRGCSFARNRNHHLLTPPRQTPKTLSTDVKL